MKDPSGLARLVLVQLERLAQLGLARATLLREAKIDERQLRDPDARIPLEAIARIWRVAATHVPDPAFGLRLGAETSMRDWGLVGYAVAFSSTLGSGLNRLAHYSRVISDALVVRIDTERDATWVRLDVQPALRAFRPAVDARLAALLSACREMVAAPVTPLLVQLSYREPADVKEYERFFGAPLEFSTLASSFLLRTEDLTRRVAMADQSLVGYLEALADQQLASIGKEHTLRDRVSRVLWAELSERTPTLEGAARTLGVSARTLQRQLRQEGTTFAKLLAEIRREMAPALLRDGRHGVSEVAFLLGYEDPSAFRRAFQRWFARSPRSFRASAG
ncbi:MAG: AraC family transcriptional regulator [Candidatus Rokuibacteriota bacterium]